MTLKVKVKVVLGQLSGSRSRSMSHKIKYRHYTQIDRDYIGSLGRDPVTLKVKAKVVLGQISGSRSPKVKYAQFTQNDRCCIGRIGIGVR